MKSYTKIFFFLMFFCLQSIHIFSQDITIKEIKELTTDFTASKLSRKDASGKSCALVKIALPSLTGISFENNVGNVANQAGEYWVYVSPGTTSLTILKDNVSICVINFAQAGLTIQSKHTYQVLANREQTRDMVFHITPSEGTTLKVEGETIPLDPTGMGKITCKPDQIYNYTITAPYYETVEDAFMIESEEEQIEPIHIALERKRGKVSFNCNLKEFELIVNNESFGEIENGSQLELPAGTCQLRAIVDKYNEWSQTIQVTEEPSVVNITMTKSSNDVSKQLRSRASLYVGGGFAFDFNSSTEMNKDNLRGYPIRIGVDYEKFIRRWFTFRPALEFTYFCGPNMKINDENPFVIDIPLIFSLNIPLGKFNRHHFCIGAGPMFGYASFKDSEESESTTESDEDTEDILAGGRVEARFTFNHFVLGLNIDYQYYVKQHLAENGLLVPMITMGYKF